LGIRIGLLLVPTALLAVASAAPAASPALPAPAFVTTGYVPTIAASGSTTVLATASSNGCAIRLFRLARSAKPTTVEDPCEPDTEAFIDRVWLGRGAIAVETVDSPSPHGEFYDYYLGTRGGSLREQGDGWGWNDSDEPSGSGCRWSVAAGGGVIAAAQGPHRLGYDHGLDQARPACPSSGSTTIELSGADRPRVVVAGTWRPLAVNGKQVLVAALDKNGDPTGATALVDIESARLLKSSIPSEVARSASRGWLTPDGLVLETRSGVTGPHWAVTENGAVTVAEGRVLYVNRRILHVRRVRDGVDRVLFALPAGNADIAAGSSGVAITIGNDSGQVRLYRLPWRTIDRTLPAR
jgi:hypothetical protein